LELFVTAHGTLKFGSASNDHASVEDVHLVSEDMKGNNHQLENHFSGPCAYDMSGGMCET